MTAVVIRADARQLPLPDACAHLIVTSPPYFGLRSYTDAGQHYDGQIGSEATPKEWLAALTACTREWMRVLKPSGSLFVNLGDKYATRYSSTRGGGRAGLNGDDDSRGRSGQNHTGVGEKSLLGLPWRYALACTDELGLILRRDIIWAKPNGLPESVTDRCRSSHEYIFHLVKQPRYYAAVDEIREPHSRPDIDGKLQRGHSRRVGQGNNGFGFTEDFTREYNPLGKLPGSVWDIPSQPLTVPAALGIDHFAAFPMELPRRIILGWSPPGICTECGEGRRPVSDKRVNDTQRTTENHSSMSRGTATIRGVGRKELEVIPRGYDVTITGYACACPDATAPVRPAVVVDPFGGTGTTALVASMLGRTGISVDRSADYCRLARWRTTDPAERARALQVPKPPPVPSDMDTLFDLEVTA